MYKPRFFIALCITSLLSACITPMKPPARAPLLTDPLSVANATKVAHDEFKKTTEFTGANARPYSALFLRAWRADSTGDMKYQIYLESHYTVQWRYYNEAYDSNGEKLDFLSIDKEVSSCGGLYGCYFVETVGINISREYLERNQDTGIKFKISGKAGEEIEDMPSAYIKGFLLRTAATWNDNQKQIRYDPSAVKPWYQ